MAIDISVSFPFSDVNPLYVEYTDNAPQVGTQIQFDYDGFTRTELRWTFKSSVSVTIPIKRVRNSDSQVLETGTVNIVFPTLKGIERVKNGLLDELDPRIVFGGTFALNDWTRVRGDTSMQFPNISTWPYDTAGCAALYSPGDSLSQMIDLTDVPEIKFDLCKYTGSTQCDLSFLIDGVVIDTYDLRLIDNNTIGQRVVIPANYTGIHKIEFAVIGGSPTDPARKKFRWIRHISARTTHDLTTADFSATPTNGLTVQFDDLSTEDPTAWEWDFGEEDISVQNPQHTYQAPGTYNVKLTATNVIGSAEKTKSIPVTITALPKPEPAFSFSASDPQAPLTIRFTDQSANTPTSWLWDFGDGQTSTEQNPIHSYPDYGSYQANLTALNDYGFATLVKMVTISLPPPSGAASPSSVQVNKTTRITLTGSGFKSGSKVRITKPLITGVVSKIISFSSARIVFDFFFDENFLGSCGISVIPTSGTTKTFPNAIIVS